MNALIKYIQSEDFHKRVTNTIQSWRTYYPKTLNLENVISDIQNVLKNDLQEAAPWIEELVFDELKYNKQLIRDVVTEIYQMNS